MGTGYWHPASISQAARGPFSHPAVTALQKTGRRKRCSTTVTLSAPWPATPLGRGQESQGPSQRAPQQATQGKHTHQERVRGAAGAGSQGLLWARLKRSAFLLVTAAVPGWTLAFLGLLLGVAAVTGMGLGLGPPTGPQSGPPHAALEVCESLAGWPVMGCEGW
jgi:hypothetical protein